MDNNNELLVLNPNHAVSNEPSHYQNYARPLTSKLLKAMELDKYFHSGEGDYLYYDQNGKTHKVLDITGGYGANLLGHRHPRILQKLEVWTKSGAPSLTQGSLRNSAGKLAKKISDTLLNETGEGPWVSTFSNSGTEAIEAAYKHALLYYKNKLISLNQKVEKELNSALLMMKGADEKMQTRYLYSLRKGIIESSENFRMSPERKSYLVQQISNTHSIEELISFIREINSLQINIRPKMISLEKAYHGKTMGALSLTSNESYREDFYLSNEENKNTIFVSQYIDGGELQEITNKEKLELLSLSPRLEWITVPFSQIAGAFVEPIQGEAGVIEVNKNFLSHLKKISLQDDFLLIFDEIQSGMYRTGKLSAGSETLITADIYTFSKSLGGGIAKIAATTINNRKYIQEFGQLHTSTFSDDDYSSEIALEVFEILQGENSPIEEGLKNAHYLNARLNYLKNTFPEIIKDIRGKGFLLAIEFEDIFSEMGFEFKAFCDSRMQGYVFASALLNHEDIRMNPSLSNNLTLRIQPSIYFGVIESEQLVAGLMNLCQALKNKNSHYFLSALYPELKSTSGLFTEITTVTSEKEKAVFLCHLIDESHLQGISPIFSSLDQSVLEEKLKLTKDLAEFNIFHTQILKNAEGKEIEIVLLAIPMTSQELKKSFSSKDKHKIISKVQRAIDYAKELGANTVGLGQFTSIVSGNGIYLDSRGLNLTTGNSFTIALTIESALKAAKEKNIDLSSSTAALIGAAGNIMSVATALIADELGKIITIHHTPINSSHKYQESTRRILNEIKASHSDSKIVRVIKDTWTNQTDILEYLAIPEVRDVFEASADLTRIQEAHIILSGASASSSFLTLEMFRKNAVIVDIAVPQALSKELVRELQEKRNDLTYHLGGVASLPLEQSIKTPVFPLNEKECFACMAETFTLGFLGKQGKMNIGDLSKKQVLEISKLATIHGFKLGNYKSESSL